MTFVGYGLKMPSRTPDPSRSAAADIAFVITKYTTYNGSCNRLHMPMLHMTQLVCTHCSMRGLAAELNELFLSEDFR